MTMDAHEKRSYVMSKIKKKNTQPEMIMRQYLFRKGFRFRIHVKNLPGIPDIVLPKHKTIFFVNGCFWHAHENCKLNRMPKSRKEYWIPKIKRNCDRDLVNKSTLETMGWNTITVWECQLKSKHVNEILEKITDNLRA